MEIHKSISILSILLVTVIMLFLFVMPKYEESKNLELTLAARHAEYLDQSSYYARVSKTLAEVESRQEVLKKINSALPNDLSLSSLVYFLQKKGVEAGLTVKAVNFSQVSPGDYNQLPTTSLTSSIRNAVFTVDVSGSYQGLKNFLASLDKSARLFEVSAISFASAQSTAQVKPPTNFMLEVVTHTY